MMDNIKAINILEALASGCSPFTGELAPDESILNQRDVIRALQFAIDHLRDAIVSKPSEVRIESSEVQRVIQLFKDSGRNASPNNLAGFFLGTRQFQNPNLVSDSFYGKFQNLYTKGQLIDYFSQLKMQSSQGEIRERQDIDYSVIDYFQKDKFNKLTREAINQLKEKINEIGVLKTEDLSVSVQNARKNHRRAYEVWSEKEKELLRKAILYTNDLDLLSECFQRGKGSIESYGQRLIYESQNLQSTGSNA